MSKRNPFHYFKTLPEIIRLAVIMYVRFPLSLRNVQDLLHDRGIWLSSKRVLGLCAVWSSWPGRSSIWINWQESLETTMWAQWM